VTSCAFPAQLVISSSHEDREKDDDWNRDAKQPKKNSSTHDVLLKLAEG
jgi:hypothetical protein